MTVEATTGHSTDIVVSRRTSRGLLYKLAAMAGGIVNVVTALAQERLAMLKKGRSRRAMGVVANSAILRYRLMIV